MTDSGDVVISVTLYYHELYQRFYHNFSVGGSGIASTTLARSNGGTTVEPEI